MPLQEWILFYAVPAALAAFFASRRKSFNARLIVIHIGLIVSIFLISFAGIKLRGQFQIYPSVFLLASAIFAIFLLARLGVVYSISSIIQEWCLLLAATLAEYEVGIFWASFITALIFSLAHLVDLGHWQLKLPLALFWGILSVFLYGFLQQPMLNFAIHIVAGTILIRMGLLYEKMPARKVLP